MATTDATRVALTLEDGARIWAGTLAEFFAENPDEVRRDIIADLEGGNCYLGGGAAPIFQLILDPSDASLRAHVMAYGNADVAGVIFA